jgi:hypothetical protein
MTPRASIAACASAARSSGKVCPMTGLIRPAAASDSARSVSRFAPAPASRTCSIPRTVTPRRSASCGSISANAPLVRAVRGEPTAGRHRPERGPADLPADAVEDHVRPCTTGRLAHPLGPARFGVVDHGLGAQLPGQVQLPLAAGDSDDPCAGRMRQLHQQAAETAARRHDQHPFPPPDPGHLGKAQRGSAVVKERRRVGQAQPVRHRDQPLRRDHGLLGVTAGFAGVGDDVPADPARIHTLPNGDHLSGHPDARHLRRLHREPFATPTTPDLRVEEQDWRDGYVDHDLPRLGDRVRRLARHQHLGTPECHRLYHPHAQHSPFDCHCSRHRVPQAEHA